MQIWREEAQSSVMQWKQKIQFERQQKIYKLKAERMQAWNYIKKPILIKDDYSFLQSTGETTVAAVVNVIAQLTLQRPTEILVSEKESNL